MSKKLKILTTDNLSEQQILKTISLPVELVGKNKDNLHQMVDQIIRAIQSESYSLGLSAVQIGLLKRIFVINLRLFPNIKREILKLSKYSMKNNFLIVINPVILETSLEKVSFNEGCLSIPNKEVVVSRHKRIRVSFEDCNQNKISLWLEDGMSVIFQHELDHLNGKLMIDYINLNFAY